MHRAKHTYIYIQAGGAARFCATHKPPNAINLRRSRSRSRSPALFRGSSVHGPLSIHHHNINNLPRSLSSSSGGSNYDLIARIPGLSDQFPPANSAEAAKNELLQTHEKFAAESLQQVMQKIYRQRSGPHGGHVLGPNVGLPVGVNIGEYRAT
jgi:hypothetical protein